MMTRKIEKMRSRAYWSGRKLTEIQDLRTMYSYLSETEIQLNKLVRKYSIIEIPIL